MLRSSPEQINLSHLLERIVMNCKDKNPPVDSFIISPGKNPGSYTHCLLLSSKFFNDDGMLTLLSKTDAPV